MSVVRPFVDFPDKSEIIAAALAFAPFICSFSSTSSTTVNGAVVSRQNTDFVDIGFGALAVVAVLVNLRLLSQTRPEDKLKRIAAYVVILAVGAYQVLNGLGVFTNI